MKAHIMRKLAIIAASIFSMASAQAADYYGSIYYSNSGAYGYSYNYPTREIADAIAFKNCAQYANDCYLAIWTVNACAALARASNNAAGWAWANTGGVAKVNALTNCSARGSNCQVVASFCNGNARESAPILENFNFENGESDFQGGRAGSHPAP